MIKLNDKRKSKGCPKFCNRKGCYDKYEKCGLSPNGFAWINHCKTLDRISNMALKSLLKSRLNSY